VTCLGPPNKTVGRDTPPTSRDTPLTSRMTSWSGHTPQTAPNHAPHHAPHHAPNHGPHYHTPNNTISQYNKKQTEAKEIEDSSSVVSSTQDVEGYRYPHTEELPRGNEDLQHRRQDHFGSLIGMLSELQETNCPEIDQLLAEGNYNTEIKTENQVENIQHLHQQTNQTELGYMVHHQDLFPSSYLKQNCGNESGYRYRDDECAPVPGAPYSTQLHLKGPYSPLSPGSKGPYSPLSPGSPSAYKADGSKDVKYWERRRKNNLAAKKSRDARRVRENQLRLRVLCSENQIRVLRSQLDRSKEDNISLRERLKKYEGDIQIPSMDNYNMAAEETDYAANADIDYRMAGNSNPRNVEKYSNDDMKT